MSEKEKRYIDFLRGIAIFLMVFGHSIQYCNVSSYDFYSNILFKIIYSFHMPLFMLISGYLFGHSLKKYQPKALLVHRAQSILHPLFMCTIFTYFATIGLQNFLKGHYGAFLAGNWVGSFGGFWFLWASLAATVATITAYYFAKESKVLLLALLCVNVAIVAMFPNMELCIYVYPYFIFGLWMYKHRYIFSKYKQINFIGKCAVFLFVVMMLFFNKNHYIYTTGLRGGDIIFETIIIDLFRWSIGLIGSIACAYIVFIVFDKVYSRYQKEMNCFEKIGQKSLQIYCIQEVVFFWLPNVLKKFNSISIITSVLNSEVLYSIFSFASSIIIIDILYYTIKLLEKLKLNQILFGKQFGSK